MYVNMESGCALTSMIISIQWRGKWLQKWKPSLQEGYAGKVTPSGGTRAEISARFRKRVPETRFLADVLAEVAAFQNG